jgi:hypothetical protein
MNLKEVTPENEPYMSEDSKTALEQIDAAYWPALVAACQEVGQEDPGVDCTVAVEHDSIESFDDSMENHWSECKSREEIDVGGPRAVVYYGVQIYRGAQRRDIVVVDCGKLRAAMTF